MGYVRQKGFGQVSSGIQTIAATIQQVEGYYPGTLAYTNNNPGNLIYVGQAGATPGAGGFAAFPSYELGQQALYNQIQIYANQGLTIDQMMAKYAPAGQGSNNPTAYASTIANNLGVSTDTTVAAAIGGSGGASGSLALSSDLSSDLADLSDLGTDGSTLDPMTLAWGALAAGLIIFGISQA